jgi:hypothetical protein
VTVDVTKPDGVSPCYSLDVGLAEGGGLRPLILRTPDGTEVAQGTIAPGLNGRIDISCDGVTTQLQDRTCLAAPGAETCAPGICQ